MSILLTGGAGYIGSHTAVALLEAGHDVVLLDNFRNSTLRERLRQLTGREVAFEDADVGDTPRVAALLERHGCSAVMHFASLKTVSESVQDPLHYYASNVQGSVGLLQAMQQAGVSTLVFSSTATVYGSPQYLPLDEAHPLRPVSPYGRGKLHVEELLADMCQADPSWRVACLRYFNPVGMHASGLIGEDPRVAAGSLLPCIARVAAGLQPRLSVYGHEFPTPDGTGVRDYVHVADVASAHVAALDFLRRQAGWQAVNLGTGQGTSVLEVVRMFERISGRDVPCEFRPQRPGDLPSYYADAAKAARLLGWAATRGLDEMCESIWRWQCMRR